MDSDVLIIIPTILIAIVTVAITTIAIIFFEGAYAGVILVLGFGLGLVTVAVGYRIGDDLSGQSIGRR